MIIAQRERTRGKKKSNRKLCVLMVPSNDTVNNINRGMCAHKFIHSSCTVWYVYEAYLKRIGGIKMKQIYVISIKNIQFDSLESFEYTFRHI